MRAHLYIHCDVKSSLTTNWCEGNGRLWLDYQHNKIETWQYVLVKLKICNLFKWSASQHDITLQKWLPSHLTEWSPIWSVLIIRMITKSDNGEAGVLYTWVWLQTDIRQHKVQLPINHKYYNFQGLLSRMWFGGLNSARIFSLAMSIQSDYM